MKKLAIGMLAVSLCAALAVPTFAFAQAGAPTTGAGASAGRTVSVKASNNISNTLVAWMNQGCKSFDGLAAAAQTIVDQNNAAAAAAAEAEAQAAAEAAAAEAAANASASKSYAPYFIDNDGDGICDNYAQGNCYNGYHSGYCANGGYTDCPSYTDADNNGVCDNYANRGTGRGTGHNYGGGHHGGRHR